MRQTTGREIRPSRQADLRDQVDHRGRDPGTAAIGRDPYGVHDDRVTAPAFVALGKERPDRAGADDLVDVGLLVVERVDEVEHGRTDQPAPLMGDQHHVPAGVVEPARGHGSELAVALFRALGRSSRCGNALPRVRGARPTGRWRGRFSRSPSRQQLLERGPHERQPAPATLRAGPLADPRRCQRTPSRAGACARGRHSAWRRVASLRRSRAPTAAS